MGTLAVGALVQFAPVLVQLLQHAFGPKTGEVKGPIAVDALTSILNGLLGQGKIDAVPAPVDIKAFVDSLVAQMKTDGTINVVPSTGVANTDWFIVPAVAMTRINIPIK